MKRTLFPTFGSHGTYFTLEKSHIHLGLNFLMDPQDAAATVVGKDCYFEFCNARLLPKPLQLCHTRVKPNKYVRHCTYLQVDHCFCALIYLHLYFPLE